MAAKVYIFVRWNGPPILHKIQFLPPYPGYTGEHSRITKIDRDIHQDQDKGSKDKKKEKFVPFVTSWTHPTFFHIGELFSLSSFSEVFWNFIKFQTVLYFNRDIFRQLFFFKPFLKSPKREFFFKHSFSPIC